MCVNP